MTVCYSFGCELPSCPYPLPGCAVVECDGINPPPNTWGEDGAFGHRTATDAIRGLPPPFGGKAGRSIFEDGDYGNDFYGRKPVGPEIVRGELASPLGGQGGGGGGDNVQSRIFPSRDFLNTDLRCGGGGGGAGILIVQSLGPLTVEGIVDASGGGGGNGEQGGPVALGGGGGGGGAGGMVVLESASFIRLGYRSKILYYGGQRGMGSGDAAASPPGCNGGEEECMGTCTASRGGAGGKGLAELLTAACGGRVQPSIQPGALLVETDSSGAFQEILCERDALLAQHFSAVPHVLVPTFGPRSAARSPWYYAGWAELIGSPSFEFGGLDAGGALDSLFVQVLATGTGGEILEPTTVAVRSAALASLVSSEPRILLEDGFQPDGAAPMLPIVGAAVDGDRVIITTDSARGPILPLGSWKVLRRYFATTVDGRVESYPSSAAARVLFEGADECSPGSMTPDPSSLVGPTARIEDLAGKKLFRFRVEFDGNALNLPPCLSSVLPPPGLKFLKLPFSF